MAEITGPKVLAFTCGAFGIIIAVNLVMAYKAVSTFPGLEVKNSYVASQSFDADRTAQQALGWSLASDYSGGVLRLVLTDAQGRPAPVQSLSALVGRSTEAREDRVPEFRREAATFTAPLALGPGKWMMQIEALSEGGTPFRQRIDLLVKG